MNTSSDDMSIIMAPAAKHIVRAEHNAGNPRHKRAYQWRPSQIKIDSHLFAPERIKQKSRKTRKTRGFLPFIALAIIGLCLAGGYYEMESSFLQAKFFNRYTAGLQYHLADGPSDKIIYPTKGPYNIRFGYTELPVLLEKLHQKGMVITRQVQFNQPLLNFVAKGLYIPYEGKSQAGLHLLDSTQKTMYQMLNPKRVYGDFSDLPSVIIRTLLFIENRDLLSDKFPKVNPAIDWKRFFKAVVVKAGTLLHIDMPPMGGSTLATQTEKFRYSANGVTSSVRDKLTQIVSASVLAYRHGEETTLFRQQLVLDYINSVPLSGAPGYGEVNGLGDGLFVWYNTNFDEMNRLLNLREPHGEALEQQARVIKQAISLMIAHRRPSFYLVQGRNQLSELSNAYARLLAENNILSPTQSEAVQTQQLVFRNFRENTATTQITNDKGVNVVRNRLGPLFETSLYTLDRMDISVTTTLNSGLQEQVSTYLNNLAKPTIAKEYGLVGKSLLKADQADDLSYSFTLFERTPSGNMVRVQTDTTQLPFDINEGSKLELGSTAKLRTLATYLQIIAELHHRLSWKSPWELTKLRKQTRDTLTLWVAGQLQQHRDLPLRPLLEGAMARRYSASPDQHFFTGGGMHIFKNFSKKENDRIVSVAESVQYSINLPFVRIMADVVKYCREQRWPNSNQLIRNDKDPRREGVLKYFIERDSKVFLHRFWNKYRDLNIQQRWEMVLAQKRSRARRLTILHRQFFPGAGQANYIRFIHGQLPTTRPSDKKLLSMYNKYAPGNFNFQDMGYLAKEHPLELWLLWYLQQEGKKSFSDAMAQSRQIRHNTYRWLMQTKDKRARKDRVKIVLEQDAFSDIHRRWKSMGYPFDHLVPSLGTALGSSGDRPAALAELMGIIINDGKRIPTQRFTRVEFAKDTPYETIVEPSVFIPLQVLYPEVARVLKEALEKVVSEGTAKRLHNSFQQENGEFITIGGKTGTGDNRIVTATASGIRTSSKALNRTATFVFYIGDNHFGTLTAFVTGRSANAFRFTSALALQVLKGMVPILQPHINGANRRPL